MTRPEGWLVEEKRVQAIIGCFYRSYNKLGYGFLESVYAAALAVELLAAGHTVQREVWVDVLYDGRVIARQRLDFVVDGLVVLELKSTAALPPMGTRQLFNYLRATRLQVGLLLHYGPKPRFYRVFSAVA